jgi:hypothetical protein
VSDPTFNSVKIRQDTIGAVGDLLTIDTVGAGAGNGAALSFINNSAVEGLHFVLGRISTQRVDATTVRMDLAVANDPTISSGDDTPPALSLLQSAGGLSVATAAGSTLAVGGSLSVSGASSMSGTLNVGGAATLAGPLNVGGAAVLGGTLTVGGAIIPAAGNADTVGIRFPNDPGGADDQAWIRYYAQAGTATTLEIGVANDADDHIALMPTGNVGIGTVTPGFKLDVADRMRVREGPSNTAGIWFHQRTPNSDQAFVGMASDTSVGFWGNTGAGWGLVMDTGNGNVGIGLPNPAAKLHIDGNLRINGPLALPNSEGGFVSLTGQKFDNESALQKNNLKLIMGARRPFTTPGAPLQTYEFAIGHTFSHFTSGVVVGDKLSPGAVIGFSTSFGKVFSINQNGNAYFAGGKTGYVVDHFVNRVGDTLEQGDVVVISQHQSSIFTGADNNIPLPEVDLTDQAYDKRVCGIVARAVTEDDLPHVEPSPDELVAPDTPLDEANRQPYVHRLSSFAAPADAPRTAVQDQQIGAMVTLGAFAHCKVDADIAPIEIGDLLTTSPTRGHAQKVLAPERATGAIIAKALAPLAAGKGKIPVIVLLQ